MSSELIDDLYSRAWPGAMRGQAQKLAADPLLKWHAERGKEALRNMERLIADDHFPIGWDERDAVV